MFLHKSKAPILIFLHIVFLLTFLRLVYVCKTEFLTGVLFMEKSRILRSLKRPDGDAGQAISRRLRLSCQSRNQSRSGRSAFLNLGLDVEIDGVTYHLISRLAEKTEMGEVIDTIELERSQRQTV